MAKPVFGISNKREGTLVFMDDGTVWGLRGDVWTERDPLPNTERAEYTARFAAHGKATPDA